MVNGLPRENGDRTLKSFETACLYGSIGSGFQRARSFGTVPTVWREIASWVRWHGSDDRHLPNSSTKSEICGREIKLRSVSPDSPKDSSVDIAAPLVMRSERGLWRYGNICDRRVPILLPGRFPASGCSKLLLLASLATSRRF